MPPSIHPVDLIAALRQKHLTPAIVFLTSRRACDDAMQAFERDQVALPPARRQTISATLKELSVLYPSIAEHPLVPVVERIGVAAHHAGHLPSWKIAIEELMRQGLLDAVFATTTLAAGVDFPARTVVITQSSVRKARDFTDLTNSEVQQLAGRAGRRGKDLVGFAIVTPSPYIDLGVITKGFTGQPEPIDSQFSISYSMALNLLKAHPLGQIQSILARSFAQFQLNRRFDNGWAVYNNLTLAKLETTGSGAWWDNSSSSYGEDLGVVLTAAMIDSCQALQVGRIVPMDCWAALGPHLGQPVSTINRAWCTTRPLPGRNSTAVTYRVSPMGKDATRLRYTSEPCSGM